MLRIKCRFLRVGYRALQGLPAPHPAVVLSWPGRPLVRPLCSPGLCSGPPLQGGPPDCLPTSALWHVVRLGSPGSHAEVRSTCAPRVRVAPHSLPQRWLVRRVLESGCSRRRSRAESHHLPYERAFVVVGRGPLTWRYSFPLSPELSSWSEPVTAQ